MPSKGKASLLKPFFSKMARPEGLEDLDAEARAAAKPGAPARSILYGLSRHVLLVALTVALGGFIGAAMIRYGPGFGMDEADLDSRLDPATVLALQQSRVGDQGLLSSYGAFMKGLLRGDLGFSHSFRRPVAELVAERAPVTLELVAIGVAGGWLLGLALALPTAIFRHPALDALSTLVSGLFLCIPAAVLALLLFLAGGPVQAAVALLVFPKVFRYSRNLLAYAYGQPHVLAARARGLSPSRILCRHVFPVAAPQLAALAGVSVSLALGVSVPVEVLCDLPGVGQLAWKAAMARDLQVLVVLTILIAAVAQTANSVSELFAAPGVRR
jgi:peptide/nickel transport system permease protein